MENFLEWMLESSLLVIMILGIRKIFMKKIPYAIIYALWAVAALRFMIPVNFISTPLSVANIFTEVSSTQDAQKQTGPKEEQYKDKFTEKVDQYKQQYNEPGIISDIDSTGKISENLKQIDNTQKAKKNTPFNQQTSSEQAQTEKISMNTNRVNWTMFLIKGWMITSLMLFAWMLFSNFVLLRKMKKNRVLYGQRKKIKIYIVPGIKNPCLYGFFRPAIYLPASLLSADNGVLADTKTLELAITHESVHYMHKDHIWAMLRMLLVSVYWFDPFIWMAASCSKKDAELFCDETTIRISGEDNRFCYGEMLVQLAGSADREDFRYFMIPMSRRGKEMEKRIRAISEKKHYSKWVFIPLAVLLLVTIGITCSTGIHSLNKKGEAAEGMAKLNPNGNVASNGSNMLAKQTETEKKAANAEQVVNEQISAYADFLKDHAKNAKYRYYSLVWLGEEHVILLVSNSVNAIDNDENQSSNTSKIYNLVNGEPVFCGKAACSSSGEWIHVSDGTILTDSHHSVTRTWVEPESDSLYTETAEEDIENYYDKTSEFYAWMKTFNGASSVIFYTNPYIREKTRKQEPNTLALQNYAEYYEKRIISPEFFTIDKDFTQDGKKDTLTADIAMMRYPESDDTPTLTITSGKTGSIIYSLNMNTLHKGYSGVYIFEQKNHASLMLWNNSIIEGIGTYEWKIFDLTENGEEQVLEQDRFTFDLNHLKPEDPENLEKFANRLNPYLKKAMFWCATKDDEVVLGVSEPPLQGQISYDPSTDLAVMKLHAAINENFEAMNNGYTTETLLSSNPYTYIDNDYYRAIIALGFDAVGVLQNKSNTDSFSGLNSYISAIAIEEITKCKLSNITGKEYQTADEFYKLWDETISNMPGTLIDIIENKDKTIEEKVTELENYGIFGEAFVNAILEDNTDQMKFLNQEIDCTLTAAEKQNIRSIIQTDAKELNKAVIYLKNYKK